MDCMHELAKKWDHLRLNEKKQDTIIVGEDILEREIIKERCSLVGKNFPKINISREAVKSTMGKIWRISKPTTFTEIGTNMFIITFATKTDKYKVTRGKPWLFDGNLFALKDLDGQNQITKIKFETESLWVQHELPIRFMDHFYENLIGKTIGKVLKEYVDNDDTR